MKDSLVNKAPTPTMATKTIQSNAQYLTSNPSPSVDSNRRKHPCVLCQQRKVKCDRNEPCANCTKACTQCISSTMLPPKRRKKRFAEAELLARLRRYEDHLRRYGADIDAINNEVPSLSKAPDGDLPPKSEPNHLTQMPPSKIQPRHEAVRSLAIRRSLKHVKNNFRSGIPEDFREAEELLQASSDDESLENPILKAYDAINSDGSDFFFSTPSSESITDLHPSPVQIFRLWQTFIDNINPLVKIFHAPSIQQRVLEASGDLENIPKDMEALMFAIYATAITSLNEEECMSMFGEEKQVLLARYQNGSRQALSRAGLLRSSDMTILQAFVLYLISCLNFSIDPRAHFCLTGIAVRIAQRMGLNYDGTTYALPPFETEMRRRLWFQIMFLDNRVSELSGAGCSILNYIWTTQPPLNVNDSDLFPDMKDPPLESKGLTEMAYVLQRCEIVNVLQDLRSGRLGESIEEKDRAILSLKERLTERYDQYCDRSVPLHLISSLMMRGALAKLEMGPRNPHSFASSSIMPSATKDKLFTLSLEMIEVHNTMLGSQSLKRFMWHITTNFPFPAHVYLLVALRQRTTGLLVERAWEAFADHYEKRRLITQISHIAKLGHSSLHAAVANLTFKAWAARERDSPGIEIPRFVMHLMSRLGVGDKACPNSGKESLSKTEDPPYLSPTEEVQASRTIPIKPQDSLVTPPLVGDEMVPTPPVSHIVSSIWPNEQTPIQFDLAMGMSFDDEMMQDLTPSFGGDVSNGEFGFDPWSDFQPDAYIGGDNGNMNSGNSFNNGPVGNGFGRQYR